MTTMTTDLVTKPSGLSAVAQGLLACLEKALPLIDDAAQAARNHPDPQVQHFAEIYEAQAAKAREVIAQAKGGGE